jgi:exopolysaccharide production protein ExoZ
VYKSLQAGRAIAAILVVLFHLGIAISADKYFGITAFSIPFSFGGAGVNFFFVLSGFIILTAHRNDIFQPRQLKSYIKKRLIRIYPTYWIIFLSVFFLALASAALRNTVPHNAFILLKSLFLIPQDIGAPVIIVAWTLQYEMLFYLFFAFLILSRWLSIIAVLAFIYIYINYHGAPLLPLPLLFLSSDNILLFVMGMAVSVTCTSKIAAMKNKPVFYTSVGIVGVMLFLLLALSTVTDKSYASTNGINRLIAWQNLLYGLASSLIIFCLVKAEDEGHIIGGHGGLQLLGNSSYALYLIHYPLISVLCKLSLLIQLNKFGVTGAMIAYIIIFGICLLSSVVFFLWIEKPVITYLRNRPINILQNPSA